MILRKSVIEFLLSALSIASLNTAFGQDAADALRYSYLSPMGTARSMGFGNALGSIGGDFTSLSVNPAGIGVYRQSEFMFTPSLKVNSASGSYLNDNFDNQNTKLNVNNIGIVLTYAATGKDYNSEQWKAASFGVGMTRTADFNRDWSYGGLMKDTGLLGSSFSEVFADDANQNPSSASNDQASLAYLGYQSYLIDQDSATGTFYSLVDYTAGIKQLKSVRERGGINELDFSLGGNFMEQLFLGITVGVPFIQYERQTTFEERDVSGNNNNDFNSFKYSTNLKTSGTGFNIKIGAIYKPADYFRLGVAVHSPSFYNLSDIENRSVIANTEAYQGTQEVIGAEQRFDYLLRTPWRFVLSGSAFLGKFGFFSLDYEYIDYGSMRYTFQNAFRSEESARNRSIAQTYKGASNVRLGLELRLDQFYMRGGYGLYGSPFENTDAGFSRIDVSAGLGIRFDNMFADIGFVHSQFDYKEQPYFINYPGVVVPTAKVKNRLANAAVTIGWKF